MTHTPGPASPTATGTAHEHKHTHEHQHTHADAPAQASAHPAWPEVAADGFWEDRYRSREITWSGRPNGLLVSLLDAHAATEPRPAGARALDVGCGEGADAIWLALQGWETLGVDVSATAVARAEAAAREAGVGPQADGADGSDGVPSAPSARFRADGLLGIPAEERFDLVCASYLHGPAQGRRENLIAAAGERVARGGLLFLLSHLFGDEPVPADGALASAAEIRALGLDDGWECVRASTLPRTEARPSGEQVKLADRAILLRRTA
ncbi:class I SAM-dependent methyltransferase [Brachybacterium sp. DNPG3]